MENITDEIALKFYCSKNTTKFKKKFNINNVPIDIQNYVNNRYNDSLSLKETLYRMFYKLDIHPKCPYCGNPVKFGTCGNSLHWHKTCENPKCRYNSCKDTLYKNYGVINVYQIDEVKQKIKSTLKDHYNVEHALQNKEIKNKQEKTCIEKYGSPNVYSSEYGKEKIKQTLLTKYGVSHPMKSDKIKSKFNFKESVKKQIETKRKNNSFNISKIENDSYNLLKEKYKDIKYQYKSELYPFYCDFYIPSLDLYIECNYHWTHGDHIYNENNIEDKNKVKFWKEKNTKYYNQAINTWTIRDINKINIAKKNNLNYLIFYNFDDFKNYFK